MPTQKHYLKVKEPIHSFFGKVYASLNSKSRTFLCYSDEDFPPGENGNPLILCMVNLIWMLHSFAFFQFVSSFLSFPFFENMNVFWIFICCLFNIPQGFLKLFYCFSYIFLVSLLHENAVN